MGKAGGFANAKFRASVQRGQAKKALRRKVVRRAKIGAASALGGVLAGGAVTRVTGSRTLGVAAVIGGGVQTGQRIARQLS